MEIENNVSQVIGHTSFLLDPVKESDLSPENGQRLELCVRLNFLHLTELNLFRDDTEV